MTDLTVSVNKTINSPIEEAFDAWLNPQILSKFMTPIPGMPDSDVENDAQTGGNFTIVMHVNGKKLPHTGTYLEIDRPNKLVFSWKSQRSIDGSTVNLNFTKIDDRTTKIELTHVKFIDEEARADHEGGWSNILDKLNTITI
jgi:uncharacterized protein YndB with AHSA1/START domain